MRAGEVVIRPPPFKLERQLAERVGGAPRAAGQTGDGAPDGQVEPFDEGGLDATGEAGGIVTIFTPANYPVYLPSVHP